MKEQEQTQISFGLKRITTEQFAMVDEAPVDFDKVNINIGIRFGIDPEGKMLAASTLFKFEYASKPFIIIEATCHFSIEEKSWDSFVTGHKIKFDKGFLTHLAMITVGTNRGILHTKTEGTPYNEFVLPTINVIEIIKDDFVFDLRQPA